MVREIWNATHHCTHCGKLMKKKQIRVEGITVRGWECPGCQETVLHPEDAQQMLVFHKLRKGFPVRIGALGESLIIRFPKEKAIAFGTYRIELDVRRSRDGAIVVMHDATVDRTTNGSGAVAELTLAELKRLKVGGTEPIPTLEETLVCARGRTKLLVELKDAGIAEQVADIIVQADMVDACTVSSFEKDNLRRAWEACPALARACFLIQPGLFDVGKAIEDFGIAMLIVWPQAATPEIVGEARRRGLEVRCGFPDTMTYDESYTIFKRMADMGVDEFSCGRPDWLGRMIAQYEGAAE